MATINYSETSKAFLSFVTTEPEWYITVNGRCYSFDNKNVLRMHNAGEANNLNPTITTSGTISESKIKFIVNQDYFETKVFDNVEYDSSFNGVDQFTKIKFNTKSHTDALLSIGDITYLEDTYRFSMPRATSVDYPERLRGKYLVSEYTFKSDTGKYFVLPYITTKFRQSKT